MDQFLFVFTFLSLTNLVSPSIPDIDLANLASTQGIMISGIVDSGKFGYSVGTAGDVNGDGVADFLISAPTTGSSSGVYDSTGTAYLLFGKKPGLSSIDLNTLTTSQGVKFSGTSASGQFGRKVNGIGDINGDHVADFLITCFNGRSYAFFGGGTGISSFSINTFGSASEGILISGSGTFEYFDSASNIGDFNGDGIDDFIVGAPKDGPSTLAISNPGMAYIIFGSLTPSSPLTFLTNFASTSKGLRLTGVLGGDFFGYSVSRAGDINGDGHADVLIGSYSDDTFATNAGAVYILYGHPNTYTFSDINVGSLAAADGIAILGANSVDRLGYDVAGVGDFNGDGIDDFIVSAQYYNSQAGIVYVIFGKSPSLPTINLASLSATEGIKIQHSTAGSIQLGTSISGIGDFNSDGINDIAIGSALVSPSGRTNAGIVYVIFGKKNGLSDIDLASLTSDQGFKIEGAYNSGHLGDIGTISRAGDVNGDGIADLILGAPLASPGGVNQAGVAYVLFGTKSETQVQTAGKQGSSALSIAEKTLRLVAPVISFLKVNKLGPLWFGCLSEILRYVRYLDIMYSVELQEILDQPDPELISIKYITAAPEDVEDKIEYYEIPPNFAKYEFSSSFLVNFWFTDIFLAGILVTIGLSVLFTYMSTQWKTAHSVFSKLKHIVKWNYLIGVFTSSYSDIALFSSLELRTAEFDSPLENFSFVICLIMNMLVIAGFIIIAVIINKFTKKRNQSKKIRRSRNLEKLKEELKDFEIIFEDFKENSVLAQGYMVFFLLRLYVFYTVIAYLFEYPLFQAILINIIGITTLLYLGLVRPFKDKINLFGFLFEETIIEIVNICVLVLAILDNKEVEDIEDKRRVVASKIIIVCNIIFLVAGLLYLFVQLLILLKDIYLFFKERSAKKNVLSSRKIANADKERDFVVDRSNDMTMSVDEKSKNNDTSMAQMLHVKEFESPRQRRKRLRRNLNNDVTDNSIHNVYTTNPQIIIGTEPTTNQNQVWTGSRNAVKPSEYQVASISINYPTGAKEIKGYNKNKANSNANNSTMIDISVSERKPKKTKKRIH